MAGMQILSKRMDQVVDELKKRYGKGEYHATALYRESYKYGRLNPFGAEEFKRSPNLTHQLETVFELDAGEITDTFEEGGLTKFITRLYDGLKIESVIIPMTHHQTLCVSSQVGCRMGCLFCQTGKMGLARNLEVAEIVGQLFNARFTLGIDIKNVVFMGMGEPLDNFENVCQAIRIMNEQKGLDIALRYITLSTVGLVHGIENLSKSDLFGIRLAISVNTANNKIRSMIMPAGKKNSLEKIKQSLMRYPTGKRGCFLFEYILIKDVNNSKEDAFDLADYIKPLPVRLNLIPYNPVDGFDFQSPSDKEMHQFADILKDRGVFVVKRWSKGRAISAGCGQLGGPNV